MCSGSLILAALGLLDGLLAASYPTAVEEGFVIDKLFCAQIREEVIASVQPLGKGA